MDLAHAVRRFEKYLDDYDREDDKIRLKITHTYGVMEYSKKIAERMELSTEKDGTFHGRSDTGADYRSAP